MHVFPWTRTSCFRRHGRPSRAEAPSLSLTLTHSLTHSLTRPPINHTLHGSETGFSRHLFFHLVCFAMLRCAHLAASSPPALINSLSILQ